MSNINITVSNNEEELVEHNQIRVKLDMRVSQDDYPAAVTERVKTVKPWQEIITKIGIVASDNRRIEHIVDELGLDTRSVIKIPVGLANTAVRGITLDAALVDDSAGDVDLTAVMSALYTTGNRIYRLTRIIG